MQTRSQRACGRSLPRLHRGIAILKPSSAWPRRFGAARLVTRGRRASICVTMDRRRSAPSDCWRATGPPLRDSRRSLLHRRGHRYAHSCLGRFCGQPLAQCAAPSHRVQLRVLMLASALTHAGQRIERVPQAGCKMTRKPRPIFASAFRLLRVCFSATMVGALRLKRGTR